MMFKKLVIASAVFAAVTMSTESFADTMGGGSYTYQPSSMADGHFYGEISADYSRMNLGLNTPAAFSATPLGTTSRSMDSFVIGGEAGYAFDRNYSVPVRLGLNLMYRPGKNFNITPIYASSPNYGNGQIQSTLLLMNAYYDFYNQSGYIPYIGLGAGYNRNRVDFEIDNTTSNAQVNANASSSKSGFAWDATLGVWTALMNNFDGDLFVRYTQLAKPTGLNSIAPVTGLQTNALINHLYSMDIGLGIRYDFA